MDDGSLFPQNFACWTWSQNPSFSLFLDFHLLSGSLYFHLSCAKKERYSIFISLFSDFVANRTDRIRPQP
ncbi:hypothetical protein M6B38_272885 [Iris pallida]|uniref:Uncharacterized protein n=1 Tax=Iris pallida TaxID=29817 RepID=A0AAX6I6W6_IRIPA|nr:hypothetical protein M6B38_317105 [Iris pallida]KAJ6848972.1 hypothetical protein M6B38_272885 [Iris pallida]